jgi:hypothetical protein
VRISAEATVPGLVTAAITQELVYDTPGEDLVFPKLVVPGAPYYIGHSVIPVNPLAGSSYTVDLRVGCVDQGQSITVFNQTSNTSSSCNVSAGGRCQAQVTSNSGDSVNALEISGPGGLNHDLVLNLTPGNAGVEYWRADYYDQIEDDRIKVAIGIQHPKLYGCAFGDGDELDDGHFVWDESLGYYMITPLDEEQFGLKIENGFLCIREIDDETGGLFVECDIPIARVDTWAKATAGDGGFCQSSFP